MPVRKRVTLQDIAREAGVHHTTVSLALRNKPSLPAATRERINAIAQRLGYRPDPALLALRAYRRGGRTAGFSIAYLTAFDTPEHWKTIPVYARSRAGIGQRAAELGYNLEDFWFDRRTMTPQRASQILRTRNISGLIIAPLPQPAPLDLDWDRFACVSLSHSLQQPAMHVVRNDHLATMRLAFQRVRQLGYLRIGLVLAEPSDERVNRMWSTGFLGEQAALSRAEKVPFHIPRRLERGPFLDWLRRSRPDAILSISPDLKTLMNWLAAEHMHIPHKIGVASLDCEDTKAKVSGIDQKAEVIGMTAVDVVSGLIFRNDRGLPEHPHTVLTRGVWLDGKTTCSKENQVG